MNKVRHISQDKHEHQSLNANSDVAKSLQTLLDKTYACYLITHNYHFNVTGENFYTIHTLLEDQYNSLFTAIDEIGERARTLGESVQILSGKYLEEVSEASKRSLNPKNMSPCQAMLKDLIIFNTECIEACQSTKSIAAEYGDDETEDLAIGRIRAHEKMIWMLRSSVSP